MSYIFTFALVLKLDIPICEYVYPLAYKKYAIAPSADFLGAHNKVMMIVKHARHQIFLSM